MPCRFLVVAFLVLFCSNACPAEVELVDASGKFRIRCEIVRTIGDKVEVRKTDGTLLTVKLKDLDRMSVEVIVKDLGMRIPPPLVMAQKPMRKGQAQIIANRAALVELRKYFPDLEVKPAQNIPLGAIHIEIGDRIRGARVANPTMELDALEYLSDVTDLSMLDTLKMTLNKGVYRINKEQASYVNLLTETKHLHVNITTQYEFDPSLGTDRGQHRYLEFFKYIK